MKTKKLKVGVTIAVALAGLFTIITPFRAAAVQVLAIVTCASASPCAGGNNTSTGPGVQGTSAKGNGVFGTSGTGVGVTGTSQSNTGLSGTSAHWVGVSGQGPIYGVFGLSFNGAGIVGETNGGKGVYASSTSGNAVFASSKSGNAIYATTGGGLGASIYNFNGNGADITGSYIGTVVRAPANAFPLVATDSFGDNEFIVTGTGDVFYHGTLNHFAAMRNRMVAHAYVPNATTPTVEDSGTARVINGQAIVRLDSAFAQSIDASQPYQVILTPGGDTHGLFVATKTPGEFVVRENQAGHGTMSFDYHIYAHAFGHAKERMVLMSESAAASLLPRTKPSTTNASVATHPQLKHTHL